MTRFFALFSVTFSEYGHVTPKYFMNLGICTYAFDCLEASKRFREQRAIQLNTTTVQNIITSILVVLIHIPKFSLFTNPIFRSF